MDLLFLLNCAALGVGMAMDAFSVSLANALREPRMGRGRMAGIAGVYALFQYAMPLIGWICVHTIIEVFSAFEKLVPWIALVLLCFIGGKMVLESLKERKHPEETAERRALTFGVLLLQGVATSIDALSVGFTIAEYGFARANVASLIIALMTFVLCFIALTVGKKVGTRLSWRAGMLGGLILIAIGIEIFVKGML
ncbi:MAG: manganese efflux pump [Clostridia bacterium]|nr:manganese efflux pump [Clostridia bacterium]